MPAAAAGCHRKWLPRGPSRAAQRCSGSRKATIRLASAFTLPYFRPWGSWTGWGASPSRPGIRWASPSPPTICLSASGCPGAERPGMADIEVHIDFAAGLKRVGTLRRHARRGQETTSFEYHPDWLADQARFSLEPALALNRGAFTPAAGAPIFGSIGDFAPGAWGPR